MSIDTILKSPAIFYHINKLCLGIPTAKATPEYDQQYQELQQIFTNPSTHKCYLKNIYSQWLYDKLYQMVGTADDDLDGCRFIWLLMQYLGDTLSMADMEFLQKLLIQEAKFSKTLTDQTFNVEKEFALERSMPMSFKFQFYMQDSICEMYAEYILQHATQEPIKVDLIYQDLAIFARLWKGLCVKDCDVLEWHRDSTFRQYARHIVSDKLIILCNELQNLVDDSVNLRDYIKEYLLSIVFVAALKDKSYLYNDYVSALRELRRAFGDPDRNQDPLNMSNLLSIESWGKDPMAQRSVLTDMITLRLYNESLTPNMFSKSDSLEIIAIMCFVLKISPAIFKYMENPPDGLYAKRTPYAMKRYRRLLKIFYILVNSHVKRQSKSL